MSGIDPPIGGHVPRLLLRAAALAALLLSTLATPVAAHAELVSATPGPGDEVTGSPDELVARFSQDLVESRTTLEVRNASGTTVARGGELGRNPREFRLELPELAPGTYEVRYATFSAEDSELHRDTFEFTVLPEPTPSPTPSPTRMATAPPSPSPSPMPSPSPVPSPSASAPPGGGSGASSDISVVLPIVAALAVVAAIGVWLWRRRSV